MQQLQTKSILAKLMATENLTVEQRKVSTAYFDVKARTLVLPILTENLSSDVYDLFIGHEVGHALFTPHDGLIEASEKGLTQSVINVIEDARIERKIKSKYPGIRKPFVAGYNHLMSINFFGTQDVNINDYNFIDRANLYFKIGSSLSVTFKNDTEIDLINKISKTQSFDDVIELTKTVMDYLEQEQEQNLQEQQDEDDESYDESDEYPEFDEDEQDQDGDADSDDAEEEDESQDITNTPKQQKQIESETDTCFNNNISELFVSGDKEYYYANIPDINLNDIIVDYKTLWAKFRQWESINIPEGYNCFNYTFNCFENYIEKRNELFQNFRTNSIKTIKYLVKEFELKKNAQQLKRAAVSKSGELDMNQVYSYKFNDDIFKRITTVPNGQSHGLIIFVDWSGSMIDIIHETIKQLLEITQFCKLVNIPFECYAFTDYYSNTKQTPIENDIYAFDHVNLMNILSSRMSTNDYNYAARILLYVSQNFNGNICPNWFYLNGTPLNAAIMAATKILPKFKNDNKLQIVNSVFLTDGLSTKNHRIFFKDRFDDYRIGSGNRNIDTHRTEPKNEVMVIRHPKTKHQIAVTNPHKVRELTNAYITILKQVTNCNIIGFYLIPKNQSNRTLSELFYKTPIPTLDKIKSEFRKNNYKIMTNSGFDEYYLLRIEPNTHNTEIEIKPNATTKSIVKEFTNHNKYKMKNRIILDRFIKNISTN